MESPVLAEFCQEERQQIVGAVANYCGDASVAEEVAQEAFARASARWDEVQGMSAPGAWVYRVAINLAHSRFRRKQIERRVLQQLRLLDEAHEDAGRATADRLLLERALDQLPARQRAAVALRYLLDWSVADVADAMDTTQSAVKALTHRGLVKLRDILDPSDWRRPVAKGVVAVIALVVAAVLVTIKGGHPDVVVRPPPMPNPVPMDLGEEALSLMPPDRGAVLQTSGAVEGIHVIRGQGPTYTEGVLEEVRWHVDGRLGITDKLIIVGNVAGARAPTSGELRVTVVLDGETYLSTEGECEITLTRIVHPVPEDVSSGIRAADGSISCTDLQPLTGTATRTLDLVGRFVGLGPG